MWWLESADADSQSSHDGGVVEAGDVLRLGSHAVRLDDIVSYKLEEVIERDYDGLLVNASVLLISAGVFLIGLLQFGWLERVLIGFVLLIILGMSGAAELMGLNQIRSMQLTVFTHQGRRVKFASTDSREIDRLIGFLRQAA